MPPSWWLGNEASAEARRFESTLRPGGKLTRGKHFMRILLVNPPHPSIGSRIPREHLPPLGLLSLGGPLIDAGHSVHLVNAEFGPMTVRQILACVIDYQPDALLIGHSGSTSGHPSASRIMRAVRQWNPEVWIIYGGVFPTYHSAEIMKQEPEVDFIVRGEGEETIVHLITALELEEPLKDVTGIVYRDGAEPGRRRFSETFPVGHYPVIATRPSRVIPNLDALRVGWELIDHKRYTYYGKRRAVVVQFSRGCPHRCHYCGQHGFWRAWRHRDPVKFAAELARLHREQGVELINLADENPSADRPSWQAFLEALIVENVPLILIGTTRAGDIVRDADILHLYKRAGIARFLLGLESTDDKTLQAIHKGSTKAIDREAIRLMRQHGIISMAAWVAGFAQEKDSDYWRTLRQLLSYDPDQIQALYATPHSWTPFALQEAKHRVIQTDLGRWDYKHQVLESTHVPNWRVVLWVKTIEAICQLRPKSLLRLLAHPEQRFRAGMRWYSNIGKRVWLFEVWQWLFHDRRTSNGPTVGQFVKGSWNREPSEPTTQTRLLDRVTPEIFPGVNKLKPQASRKEVNL
ncbi:MAG: magnesium-protoporphyrin monomethyl ester anaerobic oxidative cyclase [Verrucomicrobiales bacterium]|nr:magnesium-protoporphyrin monomethyl ester anaerobic oxidative cyclase [Verrucomicrobiales bacterium]